MKLSAEKLLEICSSERNNRKSSDKYAKAIWAILKKEEVKEKLATVPKFSYEWFTSVFESWLIQIIKNSARRGLVDFKAYLLPVRMKKLLFFAKVELNFIVTPSLAHKLKNFASNIAKTISGEFSNAGAKQARPLMFSKGLEMEKFLRFDLRGRGENSARSAGLMLLLCLHSGGRFGDFYRLRWRDISLSNSFNQKIVITFRIISKTDPFGEKEHKKTIFDSGGEISPLKWLISDSKGKSDDDYVFPFIKNNKHTGKHMRGDHFRYQYAKAAEKLGWDFTPTGHSARNSMASTMVLAGATEENLRIFFNWCPNSQMPHHYKRTNLEKSRQGCAYLMSELISNNRIDEVQSEISLPKNINS